MLVQWRTVDTYRLAGLCTTHIDYHDTAYAACVCVCGWVGVGGWVCGWSIGDDAPTRQRGGVSRKPDVVQLSGRQSLGATSRWLRTSQSQSCCCCCWHELPTQPWRSPRAAALSQSVIISSPLSSSTAAFQLSRSNQVYLYLLHCLLILLVFQQFH